MQLRESHLYDICTFYASNKMVVQVLIFFSFLLFGFLGVGGWAGQWNIVRILKIQKHKTGQSLTCLVHLILFVVGEYMNPISEEELNELAEFIPPPAHEKVAAILKMEGEVVANLRGEHRDNMHGVSLGILRKWRNVNHQKGNRVVSLLNFFVSYMSSQNNPCQSTE